MNKVLTFAIVCLLFTGCRKSTLPPTAEQPLPVHAISIQPANKDGTIEVAGVVRPRLEADLAAQIVAPVAVVTKRVGDSFRRGEMLVRLHSPALDANVAQANAALNSAEKQEAVAATQDKLAGGTLGRYSQLRQRHSVTPFELDQVEAQASTAHAQQQGAQAQTAAARSMLAAQRANASNAVLYAPFDGVVTKRMVDPGAMATPGLPLLHVQSAGGAEVEFSVPEDLVAAMKIGRDVTVATEDSGHCNATVADISPAGDPGSHSFVVKALLPTSTHWNTGSVVQVFLSSGHRSSSIVVPSQAIVQQGGLDAVLVATADGFAQVRYVTLGMPRNDQTEVLSGLRAGDRVLLQGDLGLAGRKIQVLP